MQKPIIQQYEQRIRQDPEYKGKGLDGALAESALETLLLVKLG